MQVRILKNEADKRALIARLSGQQRSLMFYYDEIPDECLLHEKLGDSIYLIHPPYDYDSLNKWLYLGNWQAIFPGRPDFQPLNTFKANDSEIALHMKHAQIHLIIDSFHDNIEWKVIEQA